MSRVTVDVLLNEERESLKLQLVAGKAGIKRPIPISDINRPGLALAGYFDYFAFDRVQVMGNTEVNYLRQLDPETLAQRLEKTFSFEIPCFVISRGLMPPQEFIQIAEERGVPVVRSLLSTSNVISKIIVFLDDRFSPETTVPGVLLDVYGVGTLLMGETGVGKSESALELIERGHRLVADDAVYVKRKADRYLYGESSKLVRHHMEIRGLGIVDIRSVFGVGAIRDTKRINLVVQLEEWDSAKVYDRLGIAEESYIILEVSVPKIVIPVRPGRSLAVIVEVAAMNHRLKEMGLHSAKALDEKLISSMMLPEEGE